MGMLNYFHFSLVDTVLFQSWTMNTAGLAVAICLGFFVLAFLYEGLKSYRQHLLTNQLAIFNGQLKRSCCDQAVLSSVQPTGDNNSTTNNGDQIQPIVSPVDNSHSHQHVCQSFVPFGTNRQLSHKVLNLGHLIQSVLHMVQVAVSYTLMLGFMTFNGWICLSILLGAGAGYFAFCWRKLPIIDSTEHCH